MTQSQKISTTIFIVLTLAVLYFLKPVLAPFLIAALLAYLGNPIVDYLRKLRIPRTLAVIGVFSVIMLAMLALALFLIPLLADQVNIFLNRLPAIIAWAQQFILPWINQHLGINESLNVQDLKTIVAQHWRQAGGAATVVWSALSTSGLALVDWLVKLLLIPVVTFYLLRDWNKVITGLKHLLPRRIEPVTVRLVTECNAVLGAFLRGQMLVIFALAIIYSVGLWLVGLDLALLIGSMTGILTIVPFLGVIVGFITAVIATLIQFHDWLHMGYVAIVFTVAYALESMVLTPLLVGDRIGLHPVAVIFAVLAGGHLFGIVGVLIALPVAAIVMVLLRHITREYVNSDLYSRSTRK